MGNGQWSNFSVPNLLTMIRISYEDSWPVYWFPALLATEDILALAMEINTYFLWPSDRTRESNMADRLGTWYVN